jgi:iron complex outermembrane recepter protein
MIHSTMRGRLMASSMIPCIALGVAALAALAAYPAAAAAAAASATPETTVGELVVTGTMFRRTETESPSPVTVLTAQKIDAAGITTIADAVRTLSSDNSGTIPTAFGLGFAVGSSGVALRGLTVNSTLVLIDGLRTANYALADDGERGFVDLNTIPLSVLDRVEVLKDGASSLYGADAIGGVVNLVFKPTFQGAEATGELGDSQHGGGFSRTVNLTLGHGDIDEDKYNVYLNFEYEKDDAIHVDQRGFPYNTNDLSSIGGLNLIGGQPANGSGSIYGTVTPGMLSNPLDPTTGIALPGAVSQPLRACGSLSTQQVDPLGNVYCAQNLTTYGDDQPSERRFGVYSRFTAQLNAQTQAYLSASFYENRVVVDTGPAQIQTGTPNNTNAIALPAKLADGLPNPNDPFAALGEDALINYAFGDIPGGTIENNHVYRMVAGVKGSFSGWDYNVGGVIAHTSLNSTNNGFINFPQLISDIENGTYSFINPDSNSAAVRQALAPALVKTSTTDLDSLDVSVTHDLLHLAGGPLRFGIGAQGRYEATDDPDLNPNLEAQGLGIAHTIGHHTVFAGFAELDAPVLTTVDIDLSARYDHYSDAGGAFSPKAGIKWTPIPQVALRGTFSRGFRAPSFSENGSSASEGFITFQLPQSFVDLHGGDGYTQPYALALESSANPNIKPETSTSWTAGVVFEPDRHFNISVDYYYIKKSNVIAQADPGLALNDYFAGTPLPPGYTITADLPDPAHPTLLARPILVSSPYINANSETTDGIDIDFRAKFDVTDKLKLSSDISLTDIFSFNYTQPGTPTINYVGTQSPYVLSSGAGTPKYRATWTTSVDYGPFDLTATAYYVSSFKMFALDVAPGCFSLDNNGNNFPPNCTVSHFIDVDLSASYKINDKIDVFADVLNVFDTNAPFDPIDYAGVNYNPTFAQAGIVGRFFKIGIHVKL